MATLVPLFQEEQEARLSDSFSENLLEKLQEEQPEARIISFPSILLRVAAVIALVAGTYFLLPNFIGNDEQIVMDETYWENFATQDEQEAYEQTKAALQLLSSKLNSGASTAAEEISKVESISKVFK